VKAKLYICVMYSHEYMQEHKINVCTRVPKRLKEWMDKEVEEGYYGNIGELIRMAIFYYKEKIEKERIEEERRAERIIKILKENPELREKVIKALSDGG